MIEKEIDRCRVVEYLRVAASRTGVPKASPMANGSKPPASASHFMVVNAMTARAIQQIHTPTKNVRRSPSASVTEPARKVKMVIAGAHIQPTSPPADGSLKPRSADNQSITVSFVPD